MWKHLKHFALASELLQNGPTKLLFLNSIRVEKRTAQLSAHPLPYLRTQVIIKLQWLERAADCNKVREDVARLIYLYLSKHEFFSAFYC